jgi:FkbM family methyltransferase
MSRFRFLYPKWYVHACTEEEASPSVRLYGFPNGFRCYSHSTREETELLYNEIFVLQDYIKEAIPLRDGDCIFDVGANIGLFTLRLRSLFKSARIHAFEPVRETFDVLNDNLKLHGITNVETHNCALGAVDSQKEFFFFPHQAGNSTTRPGSKLKQRILLSLIFGKRKVDTWFEKVKVTVDVKTLSSFLDASPETRLGFCKIDVEGDEHEVLQGIRKEHADRIRRLAIEVHGGRRNRREISGFLGDMGYATWIEKSISSPAGNAVLRAARKDLVPEKPAAVG